MTLPDAAQRVEAALRAAGSDITVSIMPASTRTAEDAATACNCPLGAIVKSLVFRADDQAVMVLTSGANRVHEKRLGRVIGVKLARADADFVRDATGFAIGGVSPLAHATPVKMVMDQDLMAFETIWAAAGTPHAVFPITPQQLAEITDAEILTVT